MPNLSLRSSAQMTFIRKKGEYFYLVKNRKENSKVIQDVVCYLGSKEDVFSLFESFKKRLIK